MPLAPAAGSVLATTQIEVRDLAVGDERLRAVDDVVRRRRAPRACGCPAGPSPARRLGHRDRADRARRSRAAAASAASAPRCRTRIDVVRADVVHVLAEARRRRRSASSSNTTQSCANVPPLPPYSSGTSQSSRPIAPTSRHDAASTRCACLPRRLARREHVGDEAADGAAKRFELVVEPGRAIGGHRSLAQRDQRVAGELDLAGLVRRRRPSPGPAARRRARAFRRRGRCRRCARRRGSSPRSARRTRAGRAAAPSSSAAARATPSTACRGRRRRACPAARAKSMSMWIGL